MTENTPQEAVAEASLAERLALSMDFDETRFGLIRATYINLSFAVGTCVIGASIGSNISWLSAMMQTWYGALGALFAINAVPALTHTFRKHAELGFAGLLLTGFVSGLVLGPLVHGLSSSLLGRDILSQALLLTTLSFVAVTYKVFTTPRTYSAPRLLINSLAISALLSCVFSIFYSSSLLQALTTFLIGSLGMVGLVAGTSSVLKDESIDEPISGALMLFASIFNVFIACVRILIALADDD